MGVKLVVDCDGECGKNATLINKTVSEAPNDEWVVFFFGQETMHACSKECAIKAATKRVEELFARHARPAPRCG
jgi:hypothetical protein